MQTAVNVISKNGKRLCNSSHRSLRKAFLSSFHLTNARTRETLQSFSSRSKNYKRRRKNNKAGICPALSVPVVRIDFQYDYLKSTVHTIPKESLPQTRQLYHPGKER